MVLITPKYDMPLKRHSQWILLAKWVNDFLGYYGPVNGFFYIVCIINFGSELTNISATTKLQLSTIYQKAKPLLLEQLHQSIPKQYHLVANNSPLNMIVVQSTSQDPWPNAARVQQVSPHRPPRHNHVLGLGHIPSRASASVRELFPRLESAATISSTAQSKDRPPNSSTSRNHVNNLAPLPPAL